MELLERDAPLAVLVEARELAARGAGRVVLVSGEPGIGKTSLVTRFVRDLPDGAKVLWGTSDDLAIPRPLGPLRDLAGAVSPALERALSSAGAPHETQALLLDELRLPPHPTVLVLDDVHWADGATLDTVTVVARRITRLPALLVLTFRSDEAPPGHRLRGVLDGIDAAASRYIELAPLSADAVAVLAGEDAQEIFAATGGNPFFVSELLAARPATGLPPSVANAVLGRASRLDEVSRRLVELVSVVPSRVHVSILDELMPEWGAAAEEPERRGLLRVGRSFVSFRHELARAAIRSSVPLVRRRRLHAEILAILLARDADAAEIVHHAEGAGDEDIVAAYALVAARRAAAVESNREAHSHFRRAADFADRLSLGERATLHEELALAAYTVDRIDEALATMERAIAFHRDAGDEAAVGRTTRALSRFHWYAGDGAAALECARAAVGILEPLGESTELARAYSGLSQLAMLADDFGGTRRVGTAGARAGGATRRRAYPRARARQHRQRPPAGRSRRHLDARGGPRRRPRRRRPPRGRPGAGRSRLRAHVLGAPRTGAPVRARGPGRRRGARGAHAGLVRGDDDGLAPPAGG